MSRAPGTLPGTEQALSAAWDEYIHKMQGPAPVPSVWKAEVESPSPNSSYPCHADKGTEDSFNLGVPVDQQEFHASTPAASFWGELANGLCHFEGDVCQARL